MEIKKKILIALHWFNEHPEQKCQSVDENGNVKYCNLGQCTDAYFELGVEEFTHDSKTGELKQIGYRYKVNKCWYVEALEVIEYLNFFWSYERFGMPYNCGWLEMPKQLYELLNICKIESQFFRRK